jgi:ferritin
MALKSIFPETMMSANRGKNPLLSDECVNYLQSRIQQEEQSSRIYQSMSLWLNNEGYSGAASLWMKYSKEELTHADWSRDYLLAMGITPSVPALTSEPCSYQGLPQIIEASYDHEVVITKQIKELADHAFKGGDHMLYTLAAHYLKEQVEEHGKMQDWVDKLKAFGTSQIALKMLDAEMGG